MRDGKGNTEKYFWLRQDTRNIRPVRLEAHPLAPKLYPQMTQLEIASVKDAVICYFDSDGGGAVLDILLQPTLLVSDMLKRIMLTYQTQLYFAPVQFYDVGRRGAGNPLYWLGVYPLLDCLSASGEFYPNGLMKRMVLSGDKIPDRAVFMPAGMLEKRLILRRDLAESVLRRNPAGIEFSEVETD
jgi:hypothetical protein